jgi:hypothetical protein
MTITDHRAAPVTPAAPVLDVMIAAGWDDFEIGIPFHPELPYRVLLFKHDGIWKADLENSMRGHAMEAQAEGKSAAEALWNLSEPHLGGMSWPGDDNLVPGAIPARLMAQAAVLWAGAVKECAEEARAKSDAATAKSDAATAETRLEMRRVRATAADRDYAIGHLPEGAF